MTNLLQRYRRARSGGSTAPGKRCPSKRARIAGQVRAHCESRGLRHARRCCAAEGCAHAFVVD